MQTNFAKAQNSDYFDLTLAIIKSVLQRLILTPIHFPNKTQTFLNALPKIQPCKGQVLFSVKRKRKEDWKPQVWGNFAVQFKVCGADGLRQQIRGLAYLMILKVSKIILYRYLYNFEYFLQCFLKNKRLILSVNQPLSKRLLRKCL